MGAVEGRRIPGLRPETCEARESWRWCQEGTGPGPVALQCPYPGPCCLPRVHQGFCLAVCSLSTCAFLVAYKLHPWRGKPTPTVPWERAQVFAPESLALLASSGHLHYGPPLGPLPPNLHLGKLRHLQPSQAIPNDPLEFMESDLGQRQIQALKSGLTFMLPVPSSLSHIPQQPISFLQELLALASSPLLCYCLAQTDKECLLNYSMEFSPCCFPLVPKKCLFWAPVPSFQLPSPHPGLT